MGGETVNYTYDVLNRLASATVGTWGQGFGYDGFGNLTSKTATLGAVPVLSVAFDAATNRQVGQSYDANGNKLSYASTTFDVENKLIATWDGLTTYAYDPSGKRVRKSYYPATTELYFYGITGQKLLTKTARTGARPRTTCTSAASWCRARVCWW